MVTMSQDRRRVDRRLRRRERRAAADLAEPLLHVKHNLRIVGALDLHPADFTEDHVKAILTKGRERGAVVTVRRAVTYLRSVFAGASCAAHQGATRPRRSTETMRPSSSAAPRNGHASES